MSHQLNRDLLTKRFVAYGNLWSKMEPAAIYTGSGFGQREANDFLEKLKEWYFSPDGGLFLTARAREFYFSLQDSLLAVGRLSDWHCSERPDEPHKIFIQLLNELPKQDKHFVKYLQDRAQINPKRWRAVCRAVCEKLELIFNPADPKAGEKIFASIQQISSTLRTNLADEVHSRLDAVWPAAR